MKAITVHIRLFLTVQHDNGPINEIIHGGVMVMNFCFCRFLLAIAILVLAIVWWPAAWVKVVIIIAAILLAIMSFFYNTCCCRKKKETGEKAT